MLGTRASHRVSSEAEDCAGLHMLASTAIASAATEFDHRPLREGSGAKQYEAQAAASANRAEHCSQLAGQQVA